jgi:ribosome modulation factor
MTLEDDLQHELSVLKAVQGVDRVYERPAKGKSKANLNDNGVQCRVMTADGCSERVDVHCSFEKNILSKLDAAREVLQQVEKILGPDAVREAERQVKEQQQAGGAQSSSSCPLSMLELEWLAGWLDSQADPSTVSSEQVEAALASHRAAQAGAATRYERACGHVWTCLDMRRHVWTCPKKLVKILLFPIGLPLHRALHSSALDAQIS